MQIGQGQMGNDSRKMAFRMVHYLRAIRTLTVVLITIIGAACAEAKDGVETIGDGDGSQWRTLGAILRPQDGGPYGVVQLHRPLRGPQERTPCLIPI